MYYNVETSDYETKKIYVLDTIGSNLQDVLGLDYIDATRTYSNNILETQEELGIDKADPKYLFKFSYEDDCVRAWSYVYFQQWSGKVKP